MARRKKEDEGEHRRTENYFYRKGEIYKLYGRWEACISKLAELVLSSNNLLMLKDVVPCKKDQALIFRGVKVFGFTGGTGLEFLAWISLARVVAELDLELAGKTSLEAFQIIIAKEKDLGKDLVNILYLYARDSQLFYDYLEFEIKKKPFPFKLEPEKEEPDLVERAKLSSVISVFKGIFFWEMRTGQSHPGRAFLRELSGIVTAKEKA